MPSINLTQSIISARGNEGMPVDLRQTDGLENKISAKEAHKLLMDIRAQLTTVDGKVKSGYLSLERAGDNGPFMISNRSRFSSTGNKAEAGALFSKLIDIAYGEASGYSRGGLAHDIDSYLSRKDKKLGTLSFVKLVNQLEVTTGGQALAEKKANAGSLKFRDFTYMRDNYLKSVRTENPAATLSNPADAGKPLVEQAKLMKPGDSIRLERSVTGGISVGLEVNLPSVMKAGVDAGLHATGDYMGTLKKTKEGLFVLSEIKFKGLGASAGKDASAIIEVGGKEVGATFGRVKEQEFVFAREEDAANFLVWGRETLNKAGGLQPEPGEYLEKAPEKGWAKRTEKEVRGAVMSRAQSIKPVGGAILHQKINAESTIFKNEHGDVSAHRIYTNVHEKNSLGLTVLSKFSPVKAKSSRVNSNVKLELKKLTPAEGRGGTLRATFNTDLRVGVDAHIVAACRDRQAVGNLAEIEFNRTLEIMMAANGDAPGSFNLDEDGKQALRDAIHRSFDHIHTQLTALVDPAERARLRSQPSVVQGANMFNKSTGVNVAGSGLSTGWTNGGMVTFRLPFDGGTPARVSGKVEMGYTSRSASRFDLSIGIDTGELPLPTILELKAGVNLSGSNSINAFTVTHEIAPSGGDTAVR